MNKENNILKRFLRFFLQGLVIIGPLAATVWIIWYIVSTIDNLIPSLSDRIPGLTFLVVILGTALIGWLGNKFLLGRIIIDSLDYLLEHTPGIKFIYTSLKDVMSSFVGDKKKFNHPVLARVSQSPETWRIGFITQKNVCVENFEDYVSVYMPMSYAISGWVVFVKASDIKVLDGVNAAEVMKFAVSGGVAGFTAENINSTDYTKDSPQS
ncbi:DUF502 domain-containing protein [Riemerella columbipharyngis]|uniref:Uncharacterized membrane protein n=1 Tax=Riemerella columbipharyngis TaxID=1071918 RepID=A0A1G7ECF8_9FLAO|nr:DUF502 domain-containing protein [Riemerella columbipharyngis]SDE61348.1 Uncharacterized membrane protein [Riemerella columbipharyngis]